MININGWFISTTAKLLRCGYSQDSDYLYMFYRHIDNNTFSINIKMGFRDYGVWCLPLHVEFDKETPLWMKHRLLHAEKNMLENNRLHVMSEIKLPEPYDDGYCKFCKEDFKNSGIFCSESCKNLSDMRNASICPICKEHVEEIFDENSIIISNTDLHHIKYFPEVTILTHRKCHQKIHKTNQFLHLKPADKDIKRFYNPTKKYL